MPMTPTHVYFPFWHLEVRKNLFKISDEQLNIVHKNIGNHVCLLNREQVVDRHALNVIHWIGESVRHVYCHLFN
jgi:hypothetical protein